MIKDIDKKWHKEPTQYVLGTQKGQISLKNKELPEKLRSEGTVKVKGWNLVGVMIKIGFPLVWTKWKRSNKLVFNGLKFYLITNLIPKLLPQSRKVYVFIW